MSDNNTKDDIGFDERGNPIALGDDARKNTDMICEHPDAAPVLYVAMLGDRLGVQCFGAPSEKVADLLDHIAATYRKALSIQQGPTQ